MKEFKQYLIPILLVSVCFVLIWPAIHNGYPLVYSDTGTYIASGYTEEVPVDRPIIYSLFVRYMSLSHSLWWVLIAHVLLVVYVIYMLVRKFVDKHVLLLSTITILALSFTTSVSNYTSQIMPDIYSALTLIGASILLTTEKMRFNEYILAIILVFSAMSHLSNAIVLVGITLLSFLFVLFRLLDKRVLFRICIISVIPILSTLLVNKVYSGKFQISKASNVFILGRMIEIGVVKEHLRENCARTKYVFCEDIDRVPDFSYQFLWNPGSPLYDDTCNATSWSFCWEEKNDAIGKLIKDIIRVPKHSKQILTAYAKDFFLQNGDFSIGQLPPQRDGSPAKEWIRLKFPSELPAYENAKQHKSTLTFKTESLVQLFTIILSLILIPLLLVSYKRLRLTKEHVVIITILVAGVLGNALTVVLFSTVLSRYQSRVIWLIPLVAILLIHRYMVNLKN